MKKAARPADKAGLIDEAIVFAPEAPQKFSDTTGVQNITVQPSEVPSFMQAELEDPLYEVQEGFGATVSLSRKRRGKK
mgnify:FL=1